MYSIIEFLFDSVASILGAIGNMYIPLSETTNISLLNVFVALIVGGLVVNFIRRILEQEKRKDSARE